MPIEFTPEELSVLKQAAANLVNDDAFMAAHQNRTKAEQKAFQVAQITAQLSILQTKIDNIDTAVALIKTQTLAELNAKKTILNNLKTKVESLPE